ncbi:MAG: 3'(2'), 5'-bisphosphate nucleotidase [Cryomorphaceae bacterium]|jgi:3'(2'), 5'-bisphosphate nucleotidase
MGKEALMNEVAAIARNAGEAIMEIYQKDFGVEFKSDESPVTAADIKSHKVICAGLAKLAVELPVLSEESVAIAWDERKQWNRYWLIDPLDGTKEFIKKNGEFTVNIALIEDGVSTLGVVYAPAMETTYMAAEGIGSFKQHAGTKTKLSLQRKSSKGLIRVVGSRSHSSPEFEEYIKRFESVEIVSKGSSLKFCLVAEGAADIYPRLGLTSEWDTGAGQAVAEIAGATVTQIDGSPLKYNAKEDILNPFFIVSALQD